MKTAEKPASKTVELTYDQLLAQKAEIDRQLAEARQKEIAQAVIEINERMDRLGMTVTDLTRGRAAEAPLRHRLKAKYRNPKTGETWAGRGHQPQWFKDAVAKGAKPESLLAK